MHESCRKICKTDRQHRQSTQRTTRMCIITMTIVSFSPDICDLTLSESLSSYIIADLSLLENTTPALPTRTMATSIPCVLSLRQSRQVPRERYCPYVLYKYTRLRNQVKDLTSEGSEVHKRTRIWPGFSRNAAPRLKELKRRWKDLRANQDNVRQEILR